MEIANAASPARGYSRRFWTRLRPKLRWKIMGIIPAAIVPIIHRVLFGYDKWWAYLISVLVAYALFFMIYMAYNAIALLIERDKQLEVLEIRVPQLEREIGDRKYQKLKDVQGDANVLWITREDSALWRQNRQHWMIRAIDAIADARDIDEESAKNLLFESSAMDSIDEFRILQRHMENLKTVIDSFPHPAP